MLHADWIIGASNPSARAFVGAMMPESQVLNAAERRRAFFKEFLSYMKYEGRALDIARRSCCICCLPTHSQREYRRCAIRRRRSHPSSCCGTRDRLRLAMLSPAVESAEYNEVRSQLYGSRRNHVVLLWEASSYLDVMLRRQSKQWYSGTCPCSGDKSKSTSCPTRCGGPSRLVTQNQSSVTRLASRVHPRHHCRHCSNLSGHVQQPFLVASYVKGHRRSR